MSSFDSSILEDQCSLLKGLHVIGEEQLQRDHVYLFVKVKPEEEVDKQNVNASQLNVRW